MLSIQVWHNRFVQQANWTKGIRHYLYQKSLPNQNIPILDVGCGTGALLNDFTNQKRIYCLDLSLDHLFYAQTHHHDVHFICADAHYLPYQSNHFPLIFCHFLLLWVMNPIKVIQEMKRVGKPGGAILILAEPDYGGRIDFPEDLETLGEAQTKSLQSQGADPFTGRKLAKWLSDAGMKNIEIGVLGGQWKNKPKKSEWALEWQIMDSDLKSIIPETELNHFKALDQSAWEAGSRILFIPTFYAIGIIP